MIFPFGLQKDAASHDQTPPRVFFLLGINWVCCDLLDVLYINLILEISDRGWVQTSSLICSHQTYFYLLMVWMSITLFRRIPPMRKMRSTSSLC